MYPLESTRLESIIGSRRKVCLLWITTKDTQSPMKAQSKGKWVCADSAEPIHCDLESPSSADIQPIKVLNNITP